MRIFFLCLGAAVQRGVTVVVMVLTAACATTENCCESSVDTDQARLQEAVDDVWQTMLSRSIRLQFGEGIWPSRIPELTDAANAAAIKRNAELLHDLRSIDSDSLDRQNQLTLEILEWYLDIDSELREFYWLEPVLTPYRAYDYGPVEEIATSYPLDGESERRRYIEFLRSYAANLRQRKQKTLGRAERGIRIPRPALENVIAFNRSFDNPGADAFLVADERLVGLNPVVADTFQNEVADIVDNEIRPAVQAIVETISSDEYRSAAPESVGFSQYPRGRDYYRTLVRFHTTLDIDPEEIFEYGQQRMQALHDAMAEARVAAGFNGSHQEFIAALAADPRAHAESPEELEQLYHGAVERIRPKLLEYFARLPRAPFEVRRMDPAMEATMTFGYYDAPTPSNPNGVYWFNARDLENRMTLEVAPLIYHELVPGHHLQVALTAENETLPLIRQKGLYFTAYGEGWADYASTLALEMGLVDTPLDRYAYLASEAFTVARLILDVGMNYHDWSLERARHYFQESTTISDSEIITETLRYSTDIPAQALGYRIGQKWFEDARQRSREALGERFELRNFHSAVLGDGDVPLVVLDGVLRDYLQSAASSTIGDEPGGVDLLSDVRVPMRDGVELSADIWMPQGSGPHSSILVRTPYTKQASFLAPDYLGEYFAARGYALVVQDVRGKGLSDGVFRDGHQEPEDGYDSIEWIAAQEWSNGRVCMMGLSYLGWVQWLAVKAQPPHLTCIVPTAAPGYPFLDSPYRGGVFITGLLPWVWGNTATGEVVDFEPDWDTILRKRPLNRIDSLAGQELWLFQDWVNRPTFDAYWEAVTLLTEDYQRTSIPSLSITGWYDDTMVGTMSHYNGMRESPASDKQFLMIGPWTHGQTFMGGSTSVRGMELSEDSVLDMREVHLEFFERFLNHDESESEPPKARIYVTGQNRWHQFDQYPPSRVVSRRLYLRSGGQANTAAGDGLLSWDAPGDELPDSYRFDPDNPAPEHPADRLFGPPLTDEQRTELDNREDVLIYTSAPLETDVTVVGPVALNMHASSDGRDTDFVVRLLDISPDGAEIKPTAPDGAIRARFRNGFDAEELLTPNEIEPFTIQMFDMGHQFKKGHRIRLQVTSSAFPLFHPNPNTGNPLPTDTESRVATQTIWHNEQYPSYLSLLILPADSVAAEQ